MPTLSSFLLRRTGDLEANPTTFVARSRSFAVPAVASGTATLLVSRDEAGITSRVLLPATPTAPGTALSLAHAVGAKAVVEDDFDPSALTADAVAWATLDTAMPVTRDTQFGIDPAEMSRALANAMPNGSWVAVTMRRPRRGEYPAYRRWFETRTGKTMQTHHSMSTESVVCSILVGAPSRPQARALVSQVCAAFPGFDNAVRAVSTSRTRLWLPPALGALALVVGSTFVPEVLPVQLTDALPPSALGAAAVAPGVLRAVLWLCALVLALVAVLRGTLLARDFATTMLRTTRSGTWPAPPRRIVPGRPPRKESRDNEGRVTPAFEGDYPLHPASFVVGPEVVCGLVAPQAGALSGEASTRTRAVPPALTEEVGPLIGVNNADRVHLPAASFPGGVAVVGGPGTGKTVLLRSLWAWVSAQRCEPRPVPGWPGAQTSMVALDSKGVETQRYVEWGRHTGDRVEVVDVGDPEALGIDLFALPGNATQRAATFVNAMQYAFTDGAIQGRSYEVLVSVFAAALACDEAMLELLVDPEYGTPLLGERPSVVHIAHGLCGGKGDAVALALYAAFNAEAVRRAGEVKTLQTAEMVEAAENLRQYFDGVTPATRRSTTEAARNKVKQLHELDMWWARDRKKTTFDEVLVQHRNVVVNFGTSATGHLVDEGVGQVLSAMMFFLLKNAIQRNCSGWGEQGRFVSFFTDELSMQAGSSEDVVTWLRDQGRSYGILLFLATQRPEQLPDRLRTMFLTLSTLVSYKQEEVATAGQVALQMGVRPDEVSGEDILLLPMFTAMVRCSVHHQRQQPFTVAMSDFESDRAATLASWGFVSRAGGFAHDVVSPVPSVPAPSWGYVDDPDAQAVDLGGAQ